MSAWKLLSRPLFSFDGLFLAYSVLWVKAAKLLDYKKVDSIRIIALRTVLVKTDLLSGFCL